MAEHGRSPTFTLSIDAQRCRRACFCLSAMVCPTRAIRMDAPGELPRINMSRCQECRLCLIACPYRAVVRSDAMAAPGAAPT